MPQQFNSNARVWDMIMQRTHSWPRWRRSPLLAIALLATISSAPSGSVEAGSSELQQTAIATSGQLRVSPNGRMLVNNAGRAAFLAVDSNWAGLAYALNRNNVITFLDARKKQKFNAISITCLQWNGWTKADGSLLGWTTNYYGDDSHNRDGMGRPIPDQPKTTVGNNPNNAGAYDFWDHIDYIITQAANRSMWVNIIPTWGSWISGSHNGRNTSDIVFNTTNAYKYGHFLGSRWQNHTNLFWSFDSDRNVNYGSHNDKRAVVRALAEGIADGFNGQPVKSQDGKAVWGTTLMTQHPRKNERTSSQWLHGDAWLDLNAVQAWPGNQFSGNAQQGDQITAILGDWAKAPAKPTFLIEGRWENFTSSWDRYSQRLQAYSTVFAGGAAHFYNTHDMMGEKLLDGTWRTAINTASALDMKHLFTYMDTQLPNAHHLNRVHYPAMINGSLGTVQGTSSQAPGGDRIVPMRSGGGTMGHIYISNGRNVKLKMSTFTPNGGTKNAYWYNPRDGKWCNGVGTCSTTKAAFKRGIPSGTGHPDVVFDPPGLPARGNDWVLLLQP